MRIHRPRNRILRTTVLLEGWSKVVRIEYEQRRRNGQIQIQDRDLLDRGNGVTVLLYNLATRTLLLLKQPRIIATLSQVQFDETIEACNGLMETADPEACALREVEEEVGHRPTSLIPIGSFYASPGSSLELVFIFLAAYDKNTRVSKGGGIASEGEDIELIEVDIDQALEWIWDGTIRDARTILAIQCFYLRILKSQSNMPACRSSNAPL